MRLNRDDYRDKVLGCWLGKNIGGTLGAPMEWRRQLNDVSFYTQEPIAKWHSRADSNVADLRQMSMSGPDEVLLRH